VEQTETDESSTAVGFRAAYVFDISQTDGQELPEIGNVNGDPREYRDRLGKFVTRPRHPSPITRRISLLLAVLPQEGKITLLPGQSPAEEFATLAHEVAHELMHRDERRASTSKRSRETEAEAVAFVVCQGIGLETRIGSAKITSNFTRVTPNCCRRVCTTSSKQLLGYLTLSARRNSRRLTNTCSAESPRPTSVVPV